MRIAGGVVLVEFADVAGAGRALQKDGVESGGHVLQITSARGLAAPKLDVPGAPPLGGRGGDWFAAEKAAEGLGAPAVTAFAGLAADPGRGAAARARWPPPAAAARAGETRARRD